MLDRDYLEYTGTGQNHLLKMSIHMYVKCSTYVDILRMSHVLKYFTDLSM